MTFLLQHKLGSPWRHNRWLRKLQRIAMHDNEQAMKMWNRCCENDGEEEGDGGWVAVCGAHERTEELPPAEHTDEHAGDKHSDDHTDEQTDEHAEWQSESDCSSSSWELVPYFIVAGASFEC